MSDSGELRKRKIDNHEVGKNNLFVKNDRYNVGIFCK